MLSDLDELGAVFLGRNIRLIQDLQSGPHLAVLEFERVCQTRDFLLLEF